MLSVNEKWSWLIEQVWDLGRIYERERIAEGVVELDATWVEQARPTHEERVAARVAEMEGYAAAVAADMGRPGYTYGGGPVPWAGPGHGGSVAARLREHDRRLQAAADRDRLDRTDPAEFNRLWAEYPPISGRPE